MKIAITGTRGIPNTYGGFEQFAQNLALELYKMGFKVVVYTPSYRSDVADTWENIDIKKIKFCSFFGSVYHFVYDFFSIKNAIKDKNDVILICGYLTTLPAILWFRKHQHKMLVHTDGFEWKRKKWNILIRKIIKYAEKVVVKRNVQLISDHITLQKYYFQKYNRKVHCIAYGCNLNVDFKPISEKYFLVIARNEKENQLQLVIDSFIYLQTEYELWIFTNKSFNIKHTNEKIKVWLNVYNDTYLNNIRLNAQAYIHSYTVGGTNPSLIEAMGHCKLIVAYDNEFHREILGDNALYFKNKYELAQIMKNTQNSDISYREIYRKTVLEKYQWFKIANQYVSIFNTFLR